MPNRQLDRLMWAQAYEAMERAQRLHRQFFHRAHTAPCWEAPVDIFETDECAHDRDRPAGGGPRPGAGNPQRRRADRQRRTSAARRIRRMPGSTGWRFRTGIFSDGSSCRRPGSNSPAGISPMAA